MYKARIESLKARHKELHDRIEKMHKSHFESVNLPELKREKLSIKDEISRLERLQWENDHDFVEWEDDR